VQKVTEAAAKYRRPDQQGRAAYSASDIFMARFPSSRCIEGSRHEQRLRISLVKLLVRRLNPSDFFDQEGFQERFDSDPSLGWVAGTRR